ncbi:MAG: sigma-70 family RNA polymerase sigma factor [Candidatus Cloacimonetes bacterium]|nr:sigma-70 family RNA polymerase sigma factor [Candidatus Cloacimonadota bacterium]
MNKEEIVVEYLPLVRSIAARYNKLGIPQEDLEQEGMIGLLEAADKFDVSREVKFSTYATYWIKKRILEAVSKEKKTSFHQVELNEELTSDKDIPVQEKKWKPLDFPEDMPENEKLVIKFLYEDQLTLKEISDQLGISRERVRQLKEKALRRMRIKQI